MTSTDITVGFTNDRNSSKVLRPPGDCSTNIFNVQPQGNVGEEKCQTFKSATRDRLFGSNVNSSMFVEQLSFPKTKNTFISCEAKNEALANKKKFTQRRNPITGELFDANNKKANAIGIKFEIEQDKLNDKEKKEFNVGEEKDKFNVGEEKDKFNTTEKKEEFNAAEEKSKFNVTGKKEELNVADKKDKFSYIEENGEFNSKEVKDPFITKDGKEQFNDKEVKFDIKQDNFDVFKEQIKFDVENQETDIFGFSKDRKKCSGGEIIKTDFDMGNELIKKHEENFPEKMATESPSRIRQPPGGKCSGIF